MTKHGEHFVAVVPTAQTGQMYKYYFNNAVWNTDPNASQINPTDNLNAIITDPLSFQWRKGGVDIDGAISETHTITSPSPADAGSYDVVVSNTCGDATSNAATLTVEVAPTITTDPVTQTIRFGQAPD